MSRPVGSITQRAFERMRFDFKAGDMIPKKWLRQHLDAPEPSQDDPWNRAKKAEELYESRVASLKRFARRHGIIIDGTDSGDGSQLWVAPASVSSRIFTKSISRALGSVERGSSIIEAADTKGLTNAQRQAHLSASIRLSDVGNRMREARAFYNKERFDLGVDSEE